MANFSKIWSKLAEILEPQSRMKFHEIIAIIVAGIAFILLGIVVWVSCRHHNAINKLNSTLSSLGSTERIAIDVRDINLSVRIIAYIALAFCLGVVIHYLAIALPRIYEAKENAEELQNFGVDYLGLIVAIFAVIITLLVTWQIFSTIKAKEELRDVQQNIKNMFDLEIDRIKRDVSSIRAEMINDKILKEIKNRQLTDEQIEIIRNFWNVDHANTAKTNLYKWVVSKLTDDASEQIIAQEWAELCGKNAEIVSYIDGRQATLDELVEVIRIVRSRMSK